MKQKIRRLDFGMPLHKIRNRNSKNKPSCKTLDESGEQTEIKNERENEANGNGRAGAKKFNRDFSIFFFFEM